MDISPKVLSNSIRENLTDIERQISEVLRTATELKTEPSRVRDSQGNFMLTPLLVAKAQMLHALTLLQTTKER